jgi:hypothetical protein
LLTAGLQNVVPVRALRADRASKRDPRMRRRGRGDVRHWHSDEGGGRHDHRRQDVSLDCGHTESVHGCDSFRTFDISGWLNPAAKPLIGGSD